MAKSMWAAAVGVVVMGGALGEAAVVRWVNPAGGAFAEPSNWEGGAVPGAADVPRFDLDATYTVTIPADLQLHGLQVAGTGNPTLVMAGNIRLGVPNEFSGSGLTIYGRATLQGGTIIMGWGGASIAGAPVVATGTVISDKVATAGRSASASVTGKVHGLTVVCRSTTVNGTMTNCRFGGETVGLTGGELIGGTVSSSEGTVIAGLTRMSGGAVVNGGAPTYVRVMGSLIVEGSETKIDNLQRLMAGELTVRSGAIVGNGGMPASTWGSSRLTVEDGGRLLSYRVEVLEASTLALSHGAIGPSLVMPSPPDSSHNGLIQLSLDGASLSTWVTRPMLPSTTGYGGRLSILMNGANALRVGDSKVLFSSTVAKPGTFTEILVPTIGGGREIQIDVQPQQVVLNVVAGGSPCWSADFDGDGSVGTEQDVAAFFACLGGNCCGLCASANFDGDDDIGTDADIEAFFRVLGGGAC
jgi:hypothetical protein